MTQQQKANALISHYIKLYKAKYKKEPVINRNRDKWGFMDMLTDLGEQDTYAAVDYYFDTSRAGHPLKALFSNYDVLHKRRMDKIADAAEREKIMKKTRQVVEEENDRRARANQLRMQE